MGQPVALQRAQVVDVAELGAQVLEDREVLGRPLEPDLLLQEAAEVR